jgi:BirA family biotin operon repressor/biotin-[acetyl-CoA-carboxylase] ligase
VRIEAAAIEAALSAEARALLSVLRVHDCLDSTNAEMLRVQPESGALCIAEQQQAGRGRRGREWHSPSGENIYLSLAWRFDRIAPLPLVGLATGIAWARALHRCGYGGVMLKWPNDFFLQERKLGGVLVEAVTRNQDDAILVVIGVGLNVGMSNAETINQPWIALQALDDTALARRHEIIACALNEWLPLLQAFSQQGSDYVQHYWPRFDLTQGRAVTLVSETGDITGLAAGIDDEGCFLLRTHNELHRFHSGDVSLRLS